MEFLFFNAANEPLFSRSDAEKATWTVEEMSHYSLFPYVKGKEIRRGMRIGFVDETGVFQPFEIRKVKTYEPDHYQELTCEHIVIAELSDEHFAGAELTSVTAQAALSQVLSGTLWSVGNVTASGTSSASLAMGSVWQMVRSIEKSWNVYITPRVTMGPGGITGRYLDIAPAKGVWRGIRLSLDKNADEVGVTIDDTNTLTAMYGYGRTVDGAPLDFSSVVWQQTADHPAKPAGQKYLVDPAATAAYGRNGRPRYGYYQNGDITDPEILLQKTWESLQANSKPVISIDSLVRDLYRLGYADQPIRLHDMAMVEIRQTETQELLEIVRLTVDLLDPDATRPTIGAYIPNIVYINRDNNERASGRGGGGGRGQTNREKELSEFETQILANNYQISLRAYQRDLEHTDERLLLAYAAIGISSNEISSIVSGSGVMLDESGNLVTDANGNPVFNPGSSQMWSKIQQNANNITLKVSKGDVATQLAVEAGNVTISGGNLVVEGYVTASQLDAKLANATSIRVGNLTILDFLAFGSRNATWQDTYVMTNITKSTATPEIVTVDVQGNITGKYSLTVVTNVTAKKRQLHYLGEPPDSEL